VITTDVKRILAYKELSPEQRSAFNAIRDKYVELSSMVDKLVPDSKCRTKGTDLLTESAMWVRAAIEEY
jgi:hypothetical protein